MLLKSARILMPAGDDEFEQCCESCGNAICEEESSVCLECGQVLCHGCLPTENHDCDDEG